MKAIAFVVSFSFVTSITLFSTNIIIYTFESNIYEKLIDVISLNKDVCSGNFVSVAYLLRDVRDHFDRPTERPTECGASVGMCIHLIVYISADVCANKQMAVLFDFPSTPAEHCTVHTISIFQTSSVCLHSINIEHFYINVKYSAFGLD